MESCLSLKRTLTGIGPRSLFESHSGQNSILNQNERSLHKMLSESVDSIEALYALSSRIEESTSLKALIVSCDCEIIRSLTDTLSSLGCSTTSVCTGSSATDLIDEGYYDLIVIDFQIKCKANYEELIDWIDKSRKKGLLALLCNTDVFIELNKKYSLAFPMTFLDSSRTKEQLPNLIRTLLEIKNR